MHSACHGGIAVGESFTFYKAPLSKARGLLFLVGEPLLVRCAGIYWTGENSFIYSSASDHIDT